MHANPRLWRGALRLAAAGWLALSLSACASSIDADRSSFVSPPATAARTAAWTELSLVHHQAHHGLNIEAGMAPRPAVFRGALHEAYLRWSKGGVRELPESVSQAGQ